MEQQITIPKNIVSFFYNNLNSSANTFEISDSQKCYNLLKQNYFISDKDKVILKELSAEIDSIPDEQRKMEFKNVLGKIFLDRTKLIDYSLDSTKFKYFNLCNASDDKIYFDPEIKEEEVFKVRLNLFNLGITELEIHTLNSFLSPDRNSRFLNPESKQVLSVTFKEDTVYDLTNLLKPFIREAKEIKIIDNYLANYLSRFHLSKILKVVNEKCNITFITLSEDDYLKNKMKDVEKAKKNYWSLNDLAGKFNVKIENIKKSGHLERYIITDKFEISLPGGFDQFGKDGKPYIDDKNNILKLVVERK